jgi:hypothetical protein
MVQNNIKVIVFCEESFSFYKRKIDKINLEKMELNIFKLFNLNSDKNFASFLNEK